MGPVADALGALDARGRELVAALFASPDPAHVDTAVADVVRPVRGPVTAVRSVHAGVGLVLVLDTAGGAVVVKCHRWNTTADRMTEVQRVQHALAAAGLPAPRPLRSPVTVDGAVVTVEEFLAGGRADGHDPAVRWHVADSLVRFVAAAGSIDPMPRVGRSALFATDGGIWPEPHDVRFDFAATATDADWIDAAAGRARGLVAAHDGPDVVAHLDWRVENLGFDGSRVVAVHDWDSVGAAPEAVAVGLASAQFSTDWRVGHATLPSIEEMGSFVADVEDSRGRPFTGAERTVVDAANLLLCAYGARCEHSDAVRHPGLVPAGRGWRAVLAERIEASPL